MTHPYRLDAPATAIAATLGADPGGDPWAGGAVIPGGYAPVVVEQGRRRRLIPRQWGVPPPPRGTHPVTHLRNCESPFWIGTLRHTQFRCLVPMTAFRSGRGWLAVPGAPVFACAGIWRDSEVPSFAIVSIDGTLGGIGAMPLILPARHWHAWLTEDWKTARRLLAQGHSPLDLDVAAR
jgi:putative SOS response-associated peptidase YedK